MLPLLRRPLAGWTLLLALGFGACKSEEAGKGPNDSDGEQGGGAGDGTGTAAAGGTGAAVGAGGTEPITWSEPSPLPAVAPSDPGLLVIEPMAVALVPGSTATLGARLYDDVSGGAVDVAGGTWSIDDDGVATIDDDGVVTAVEIGSTTVTLTTSSYGVATATVFVDEDAGEATVGVEFEPPLIRAVVGDEIVPNYRLLGEAPDEEVRLASSNEAVLAPENGVLVAKQVGVAQVGAFTPVESFEGQLLVIVDSPSGGGTLPAGGGWQRPDCGTPFVEGCIPEAPPRAFSKPGLIAPLRVWLLENPNECDLPAALRIKQGVPSGIETAHVDSPVGVEGAALKSLAAGSTLVRPYVTDSGRDVKCDPFYVEVGPDLEGEWTADCEEGDEGELLLSAWRDVIRYHRGGLGPSAPSFTVLSAGSAIGFSCFSNPSESFACRRTNLAMWRTLAPPNDDVTAIVKLPATGMGVCSESNPCDNFGYADCSSSRHYIQCAGNANETCDYMRYFGPDHFAQGECHFRRGGNGCRPYQCGDFVPDETVIGECRGTLELAQMCSLLQVQGDVCAEHGACLCEHRTDVERCGDQIDTCFSSCVASDEDPFGRACAQTCARTYHSCVQAECPGVTAECDAEYQRYL